MANNHESRMSLLEILTVAPACPAFLEESRPLRMAMCPVTAVAMMMAIFKVISAVICTYWCSLRPTGTHGSQV